MGIPGQFSVTINRGRRRKPIVNMARIAIALGVKRVPIMIARQRGRTTARSAFRVFNSYAKLYSRRVRSKSNGRLSGPDWLKVKNS